MKALLATSVGVVLALLSSWGVALDQAGSSRLPEWAERLGWTLVHSSWQLAAVAIVSALVDLGLKRRSANARYAAAVAALVIMVALPCVTWSLVSVERRADDGVGSIDADTAVGWDKRRFAAPAHHDREVNQDGGPAPEAGLSHPTADSTPSESEVLTELARLQGSMNSEQASGALAESVKGSANVIPQTTGWSRFIEPIRTVVEPRLPLFVVLWFLGVVVCSLRPIWGLWTQWRLRRVGLSPVAEDLQRTLNDLARRVGLTRVVRIAQSACVTVPMVVGYLRPMILLPASVLTGLTPTQLESLLAHELAHVRRHDWLVNAIQVVVETLLFYHPAVWWLSNRIRYERELCCDDIALKVIGDKATYGRMLLALEELRHVKTQGSLAVPASLAATGGSLVARVRRLMPSPPDTQRASRGWLSGAVILAGLAMSCGVWFATQATAENGDIEKRVVTEDKPEDAAEQTTVASVTENASDQAARAATPAKFDATAEILRHVAMRRVGLNDWPEWCGSPHRNNAPSGENIPIKWDLKTGENVLWKVEHKRGNMTTPVIANGKVYVGGEQPSVRRWSESEGGGFGMSSSPRCGNGRVALAGNSPEVGARQGRRLSRLAGDRHLLAADGRGGSTLVRLESR